MMGLIGLFGKMGFRIVFGTTAGSTDYSEDLLAHGVTVITLKLNHDSFDHQLKSIKPTIVLFDRFMMEEQFGWRVREQIPEAMTLLDTEDLHFLRKAREEAFKTEKPLDLYTDEAKRELASILRCDLSLIVSEAEIKLLIETFQIPVGLLFYLPILYRKGTASQGASFNERKHFVTLGNFMHPPNKDAICWLKESIWKGIKSQLPEAECHIYGAYLPKKIQAFHDPKEGFLIKGWAPDKKGVLQNARIVLAPLRFGAGLKGKILDGLSNGIPVITTEIGAEGILGPYPYEGLIIGKENDFIQQAIALYSDIELWEKTRQQGIDIIEGRFLHEQFEERFSEQVGHLLPNLIHHREVHFLGQILHHESLQSTKFMSKWITLKNQG